MKYSTAGDAIQRPTRWRVELIGSPPRQCVSASVVISVAVNKVAQSTVHQRSRADNRACDPRRFEAESRGNKQGEKEQERDKASVDRKGYIRGGMKDDFGYHPRELPEHFNPLPSITTPGPFEEQPSVG